MRSILSDIHGEINWRFQIHTQLLELLIPDYNWTYSYNVYKVHSIKCHILFYYSLIGLVLPDIKPVPIFQNDTKWVLKVVYNKHLLMVICFHPSSRVWPASPASCVVIYSQLYMWSGEMELFKDYLNTWRYLTIYPQKQATTLQLSALIPVGNDS